MNIVALVLAGGEGTRLYPLTAEHAKPALPFANGYRIVDFVLSNLVNSKISTIYVVGQYKPDSLVKHIQSAWAPSFRDGEGLIKVLLPRANAPFRGTADAVDQNLALIQSHRPDMVAVFAADHVYRMDVRQMVDFHCRRDAHATVAALAVPLDKARGFGVLSAEADGRVRKFTEKPKQPPSIPGDPRFAYASMGNYLFQPRALERMLAEARERREVDFGRDILPRVCAKDRVYAYDFAENRVPGLADYEERAYWRDVGTLAALAAAQQDATGARPRFNLWNPRWPIHGRVQELEEETAEPQVANAPVWRAAHRDRRTDERVQPS
jgi:glucose-1-phosphate adenylyltransferase